MSLTLVVRISPPRPPVTTLIYKRDPQHERRHTNHEAHVIDRNPRSQPNQTNQKLTQKVISFMILRLARNLNTLQAVINRSFPALQLQPRIRPIREKQRVARELLHSLRVKLLGSLEIAVLESLVALLFESVGG